MPRVKSWATVGLLGVVVVGSAPPWPGLLSSTSPELFLVSAGRMAIFGTGVWLLATLMGYAWAVRAGSTRWRERLTPWTWAPMRKVAAGLVSAALLVPVPATPPVFAQQAVEPSESPASQQDAGEPVPPVLIGLSIDQQPTVEDTRVTQTATRPIERDRRGHVNAPPSRTHVVTAGQSLWSIAMSHICEQEPGAYWATLVDLNRNQLRSGDPDLVYPGEELRLPGPIDSTP